MNDEASVALVTGAARGLGAATAECLLAKGWRVVVADVSPSIPEWADRHAQAVMVTQTDVSDEASVARMFSMVRDEIGSLHALVNNAGIQIAGPSSDLPAEAWRRVVDVNLTGSFLCAQAAYPLLRDSRGCVVNVSSVSAQRGMAQRAPYGATKAGIEGLTRALAAEWAEDGVRVNAVAPGYALTEMNRQAIEDGLLDAEAVIDRVPLGRFSTPAQIASAVAWLCDPAEAGFVTGTVLTVDGGWSILGQPPRSGPGALKHRNRHRRTSS